MPDERYERILGLGPHQPKTKWVCFLPWVSEFGWYIMNHVKRIHGYSHPNKIACIKQGHECLFPTVSKFWYQWADDVKDSQKGGVVRYQHNAKLKRWITNELGKDITFIDPADTSWPEKTSLAHHTFIPKPRQEHDFDIDIVVTPRFRQIDTLRNYPTGWQAITNRLVKAGLKVAVCGTEALSTKVRGAKYLSWNYTDVDTDVEMILKSKVVVSQESGLAYLTMMCKKPLIIVDTCIREVADKHRGPDVYFKNVEWAWNKQDILMKEIYKAMQ